MWLFNMEVGSGQRLGWYKSSYLRLYNICRLDVRLAQKLDSEQDVRVQL